MIKFIVVIILISILTILITIFIWSLFNRKDQRVLQYKELFNDMVRIISRIAHKVRTLLQIILEVSQSIFRNQIIDVDSKEVKEEDSSK